MISPDDFYTEADRPAQSAKAKIWQRIEQTLPARKTPLLVIHDKRSFAYGIAASFILYLAGVGAFNLIKQSVEAAQPPEARLERAYQSAIREFESVVPSLVSQAGDAQHQLGKLQSREQQLKLVNEAIAGLRFDIEQHGPSSVTSSRVRELYSLKLQILQRMIENGEIEL